MSQFVMQGPKTRLPKESTALHAISPPITSIPLKSAPPLALQYSTYLGLFHAPHLSLSKSFPRPSRSSPSPSSTFHFEFLCSLLLVPLFFFIVQLILHTFTVFIYYLLSPIYYPLIPSSNTNMDTQSKTLSFDAYSFLSTLHNFSSLNKDKSSFETFSQPFSNAFSPLIFCHAYFRHLLIYFLTFTHELLLQQQKWWSLYFFFLSCFPFFPSHVYYFLLYTFSSSRVSTLHFISFRSLYNVRKPFWYFLFFHSFIFLSHSSNLVSSSCFFCSQTPTHSIHSLSTPNFPPSPLQPFPFS